jgi:hypothetical protein
MIDTDIELLKGIANQLRIHSITQHCGGQRPSDFVLLGGGCGGHAVFRSHALRREEPALLQQRPFHLSKGHAAPLLYAAWAETGLFPVDDLLKLRTFGSDLEGHPTPRLPFVDVATGSLGQGLSVGVGMALRRAARQAGLQHLRPARRRRNRRRLRVGGRVARRRLQTEQFDRHRGCEPPRPKPGNGVRPRHRRLSQNDLKPLAGAWKTLTATIIEEIAPKCSAASA